MSIYRGAMMLAARNTQHGTAASSRGFTMIEVLVTFVILAVGVLGVVSLLTSSKTSEYESVQRARAITMADSMLEKIRGNPQAISTTPGYAIGTTNPLDGTVYASEPAPNCVTASCTPVELANHDLWAFEQALIGSSVSVGGADTAGLINPRACIQFAPWGPHTNSGQISILIQWDGLQETGDGVPAGVVCGGGAAGTDPNRRSIVVTSFVVDQAEL